MASGAAGEDVPPSASLSVPVYSLVTGGDTPSANVVTYCSPVAIQPKRIFAIGLFKGTLSHENALREKRAVLQILGCGCWKTSLWASPPSLSSAHLCSLVACSATPVRREQHRHSMPSALT